MVNKVAIMCAGFVLLSNSSCHAFAPQYCGYVAGLRRSLPSEAVTGSISSTVRKSSQTTPLTTKLYFFNDQGDSQIPEEYREKIYEIERKTPAAQGRQGRIITYSLLGVIFILFATSNVFFGKIFESDPTPEMEETLWYQLSSFIPLLSTKFGGYADGIFATICVYLIDQENAREFDTREKIWLEIKKRQESGERPISQKAKSPAPTSGKKAKRMKALAEVMAEEEQKPIIEEADETKSETPAEEVALPDNSGLLGKVIDFYKKADDMAAAQALIMNKKLEEAGVVEKITDESGLRVIGREEAKKLENQESTSAGEK